MKKKSLLIVIALAVFFIASCENLQNILDNALTKFEFIPEQLKESAAIEGVKAGSFIVEGGNGALAYSFISVSGESNDNGKFTIEGSLLKIKEASLDAGDYHICARVEDAKGQFLEGRFILTVSPRDGTGKPGTEGPGTDTPKSGIAGILESWRGVWYSHYGGLRTDGYRVGRWSEIKTLMGNKLALFPDFDPDKPLLHDGYAIQDDDYFIFYDDTVYGENDSDEGGNGGWFGMIFRYIGIVRAVNSFSNNADTGAVIIEYLDGCYPQWAMDVVFWPLPFFGIYYRVIDTDTIKMANAVDLAALSAGKAYYTETATLQEAIDKNTAANDGNFIAWGVVIPQDREK
jgi:hypothetical protein